MQPPTIVRWRELGLFNGFHLIFGYADCLLRWRDDALEFDVYRLQFCCEHLEFPVSRRINPSFVRFFDCRDDFSKLFARLCAQSITFCRQFTKIHVFPRLCLTSSCQIAAAKELRFVGAGSAPVGGSVGAQSIRDRLRRQNSG
jgi:hypothetical protein